MSWDYWVIYYLFYEMILTVHLEPTVLCTMSIKLLGSIKISSQPGQSSVTRCEWHSGQIRPRSFRFVSVEEKRQSELCCTQAYDVMMSTFVKTRWEGWCNEQYL